MTLKPAAATAPPPYANFAYHPSLAPFAVDMQTYLSRNPNAEYTHLATGAVVCRASSKSLPDSDFLPSPSLPPLAPPQSTPRAPMASSNPSNPSREPQILLLRRAPHDSMPLCWETPGGAVDITDASILHAVARELFEEAGLVARWIGARVGGEHIFSTRSGGRVGKVSFLVEVERTGEGQEIEVKLDPNEHCEYLWASEGECTARRMADGRELEFTTREQWAVVMGGFWAWRAVRDEIGGEGKGGNVVVGHAYYRV